MQCILNLNNRIVKDTLRYRQLEVWCVDGGILTSFTVLYVVGYTLNAIKQFFRMFRPA